MPTINQLIRGCRVLKKYKTMVSALEKCPQRKGTCLKIYTVKPKKPNSAIRKIARVKLTTGRIITVYIPGLGHQLQDHCIVLVRGGRANDLPGVRYKMVRGKFDFNMLERIKRSNKRSKYGVKKK